MRQGMRDWKQWQCMKRNDKWDNLCGEFNDNDY